MSGAAELAEKVRAPGYTPARRDVAPLLDLLASAPEEVAKDAARALARVGEAVVPVLLTRFDDTKAPERARLVALAGRLAAGDAALLSWLVARLADPDPLAKRRAITALGKLGGPEIESALIAAWDEHLAAPEVRALVVALGNVGRARALSRLSRVTTDDKELSRALGEARTKIERSLLRSEPGTIRGDVELSRPVPILLHVRAGLEEILLEELGRDARGRVVGPGRVEIVTAGPLERLFRCRTLLHFGFPLPAQTVQGARAGARGEDTVAAVVRALSSDAAWAILSTLTPLPVRYRIEWASGGRRKSATLRVAEGVRAVRPGLVNDATQAPWEAVVTERSERGRPESMRVFVELWPHALPDPRFVYRVRTLPASSHPTIAAALARVAGVIPSDVVWDPFVGSGVELCERALLGPYRQLVGSDLDEDALDAARENLRSAAVRAFSIERGDARTFRPKVAPTLIITNPPFGRRVLEEAALLPLFDAFFANAARVLSPSGRLVWVSPLPDATLAEAERHGLVARVRCPVDIGGVRGEIQLFVRGGAAGARPNAEQKRRADAIG